tara:strand:+ start:219 stop:1571 length:1353 start_codon:yes stop_codon:yes gene_type:complete
MSTVKVNKITPRTSNSIQLGESGDTLTIPSGATLQNCGTATGFGISFCTTTKTSPFTATAGKGFFINTGSAVTVTLPASPSVGDELIVVDATGCAATNAITLGRNGSKIKGGCNDLLMATDRGGLRVVYSGSSQGWVTATAGNDASLQPAFIAATGGTESTFGDFKIHTFTSDSTFQVTRTAASAPNNVIDYIVVAGGGGGGSGTSAGSGGGGAGGYRSFTAQPVSVQSYPVVIGAGATGAPPGANPVPAGSQGSTSTFISNSSAGGGGGGSQQGPTPIPAINGGPGGSGGGGGYNGGTGGTGNTPPVSPPQGNNGAAIGPGCNGGGGGGAGAAAVTGPSPVGSVGGVGVDISPSYGPGAGDSGFVAGGGGGGGYTAIGTIAGGNGGGGDGFGGGGPTSPTSGVATATNGTANTGGGGGGAGSQVGPPIGPSMTIGAGGSGVVIVRYKFQ